MKLKKTNPPYLTLTLSQMQYATHWKSVGQFLLAKVYDEKSELKVERHLLMAEVNWKNVKKKAGYDICNFGSDTRGHFSIVNTHLTSMDYLKDSISTELSNEVPRIIERSTRGAVFHFMHT